jgi:pSer/pThr/pTyr-binding forkhead associated (FHA) protein
MTEIRLAQKPFILVGKHPDICDVVLENPSISRKHAILQFKPEEQTVYLYDLGSTHGTIVNHRKLPSRVYHKLNLFDSIMFGSSAKIYVLRCPGLESNTNEKEVDSEDDGTDFQRLLKKQYEGGLSKEEMKEKYLDMLENDPYYKAAQGKAREFHGEQSKP